jgi:Arylsulfotransferase (ASST)/Secretion system C-terminal sorting domain
MRKRTFTILLLLWAYVTAPAQTIGLLQADSTNVDGYVLFSPIAYTSTYLIDKCGRKVNEWPGTYRPGNSVYLLEDGSLLRTGNLMNPNFGAGGSGGYIEKVSWTGQILWSFQVSDTQQMQHHDVYPMPNGNVLVLVFEKKTLTEAFDAGRDTSFTGTEVYTEKVIELEPVGIDSAIIVWEWNAWDHLVQEHNPQKSNFGVVQSHPELIHINYNNGTSNSNPDWIHLNAVTYHPGLDQVMLCSRFFSEFWIIDHSTTTSSAAGHNGGVYGKGGDLLYRWGNPKSYNRGTTSDTKLFGPHSAHWIPGNLKDSGAVMIFNNGTGRPQGNYSTVEVVYPATDSAGFYTIDSVNAFGPSAANWTYTAPVPASLFSMNISNAQRLPNGHTLICEGASGNFIEIDSLENTVWNYKNPVNTTGPVNQGTNIFFNNVFRSVYYAPDYPAFQLFPPIAGNPIELNPISMPCTMNTSIETPKYSPLNLYPNPSQGRVYLQGEPSVFPGIVKIFTAEGKLAQSHTLQTGDNSILINPSLSNGLYFLQYRNQFIQQQFKFILQR